MSQHRRVSVPVTKGSVIATLAMITLAGQLGASDGLAGAGGGSPAGPDPSTSVDPGWERIVPGGDCQCADGSEFSFWIRDVNPEKVVLFLQGGGGCWSAETCAPGSGIYQATAERDPAGEGGVFDLADEGNPFADHSVVYVPYCTGDVHLGDNTMDYAPGLTVQHKGYVNGNAALDQLEATFPSATDVVVAGESAGSVAAPLYGGLVADRLPDARIMVLADGSGSYPDVPAIFELVDPVWGVSGVLPDWYGTGSEQWSVPGLYIESGRRDPEIVFARHDYAYDEIQQFFLDLLGLDGNDLLSLIDANEQQIEEAGVNLLSYIAPGDEHTVLSDGPFYTEEVDGESLVDWVTRVIAGEPVDDVHCAECTAG